MNNYTLKNRVHRLVADQVGEDIDNITDASVLRGDFLGFDDFDMTDDEFERANTVGDLISIVQGKVSA